MQYLYRHYDSSDNLLYVGISLSHLSRLSQHKSHSEWFGEIAKVEIEKHNTREDVLEAERIAIRDENPTHNKHRPKPLTEEEVKVEDLPESALNHVMMSELDISKCLVRFRPLYSIEEFSHIFGVGSQQVRAWIETGVINAIEKRRYWNKRYNKWSVVWGITGWQAISLLEQIEKEGKLPQPGLRAT